jgi:uncharacterized phiE125 gp8 family phage protein
MWTCPITRPVESAAPTFEPLELKEAKYQCGIAQDGSYDDEWLRDNITAARQQVEEDTGLAICTRTFTQKFTDWPSDEGLEIHLRPVTAISSIVYLDTSGASTTLSSSIYVAPDSTMVTPLIRLAYSQNWPALRGDINGITVTFVAGYASAVVIPKRVKEAVKLALHVMWLRHMENNAEADRQQAGYERQIAKITRSSYP